MKLRPRVLQGFDDPFLQSAEWENLLRQRATDEVFLTCEWQRAWWESLGKGSLLLILLERAGKGEMYR